MCCCKSPGVTVDIRSVVAYDYESFMAEMRARSAKDDD